MAEDGWVRVKVVPLLLKGTLNDAVIFRSPETLELSLPSNRVMETPAVPLPAGMLAKVKLSTGGVAELDVEELARRARLEALTVVVEGMVTVRAPLEIDGVVGLKVVAVLLG
jgi:hypothetical protein